jgi:hypothetical protein
MAHRAMTEGAMKGFMLEVSPPSADFVGHSPR